MAEKKVSTSFGVRAAPESWSKYTTGKECFELLDYTGLKEEKTGSKLVPSPILICEREQWQK